MTNSNVLLEFKELDKAKQAREDLKDAFNKYEDLLKLTKQIT